MDKDWKQLNDFAALDWATDHHDVIVVDRDGKIVADFRFVHSAAGWAQFDEMMKPFSDCPIAIETSNGPAVDQLLQRGYTVYPVNPKSAARYRERKVPSGNKTDRQDCWSLADALRTDGHAWRPLVPQDEAVATLRALCRDEIALIEQRTALVNQLQAALKDYYPVALEVFDDWTDAYAWAFVRTFPTPQALRMAGRRKWEKFLHLHKLWRPQTVEGRMQLFAQGDALPASPAVVASKSLLAVSLVAVLETLQRQLNEYRRRITEVFRNHPDHDLFGSLPGVGPTLGPRLLGGLGSVRALFPDAESLMCLTGVSPVSFQSGQIRKAHLRYACDHFLRYTVHLWADQSRRYCRWAQIYYQTKREEGHSHASALRCLGKRWLKILWRLWQDRQTYDEARHIESLKNHGSNVYGKLQVQLT
jgi:transposase